MTFHPFLDQTDIPKDSHGETDYTYMSKDCFHLSQLGHARAANAYFNSILTPESQRQRSWKKEFEEFRCPTEQNPFLMTTKNSWKLIEIKMAQSLREISKSRLIRRLIFFSSRSLNLPKQHIQIIADHQFSWALTNKARKSTMVGINIKLHVSPFLAVSGN